MRLTGWLSERYRRAAENAATAPIVARVLGAIGVLALLVAAAFAFVLVALSNLRGSTNEQAVANRVTTGALRLERIVDELDQSLRGFVLTRNKGIRQNWDTSRRALPAAISALEKQVAPQPHEAKLVRNIADQARTYVTDYGENILQIAEEDPAAARSPTATGEGLIYIGGLRRSLARLLADEDRLISSHASSSKKRANQAVLIGSIALGTSGLLLLLVSGYLVRAVARPVRVVASGASRIAAGDLSTRIPAGGPAEIRELTTAFNTMAESVEHGRRELEVQNEQLRQSERAKSELITIVSHELRTPLSSILGYTRLLLKRDPDQPTLRRYVEIIHDQGERLAGLIEGFLAADERNGNGLKLASVPLDLGELVRREVDLIAADSPVDRARRPGATGAGRDQPRHERGQVLAGRRSYPGRGPQARHFDPDERPGRGPRHPAAAPVACLQQVLPRRGEGDWRSGYRPGPRPVPRDRRGARRPDRFHEHREQGLDLLVRAADVPGSCRCSCTAARVLAQDLEGRAKTCCQCAVLRSPHEHRPERRLHVLVRERVPAAERTSAGPGSAPSSCRASLGLSGVGPHELASTG
jgi:signal transduction histidine kinase